MMIGMVVHKRSVRPGGRAATRARRYRTTKTSERCLERQKQGQNDGQEQVDNDGHSTLLGFSPVTRPESTLWAGRMPSGIIHMVPIRRPR